VSVISTIVCPVISSCGRLTSEFYCLPKPNNMYGSIEITCVSLA
jgi:hypothetical protein